MTKPSINCYVCGTWIRPMKGKKRYVCPKCKAVYEIVEGKVERIYNEKETEEHEY